MNNTARLQGLAKAGHILVMDNAKALLDGTDVKTTSRGYFQVDPVTGRTSVPWVFAAVLIIGFGQSLSITAQSALVSDHCQREMASLGDQTVYGVYRLVERFFPEIEVVSAG
jgi:hypothetical protein